MLNVNSLQDVPCYFCCDYLLRYLLFAGIFFPRRPNLKLSKKIATKTPRSVDCSYSGCRRRQCYIKKQISKHNGWHGIMPGRQQRSSNESLALTEASSLVAGRSPDTWARSISDVAACLVPQALTSRPTVPLPAGGLMVPEVCVCECVCLSVCCLSV